MKTLADFRRESALQELASFGDTPRIPIAHPATLKVLEGQGLAQRGNLVLERSGKFRHRFSLTEAGWKEVNRSGQESRAS